MRRAGWLGPALLAGVAAVIVACATRERTLIVPALHLHRDAVAIGGPLDVSLTFHVPRQAEPLADDHRVLLRFLFDDGKEMGSDDHDPPVPTRQWQPGRTVTYTRRMFVPDVPYVGPAAIVAGLYSRSGTRLRLAGKDEGDRRYRVGTVTLNARRILLVPQHGWHRPESPPDEPGWRWIGSEATMTFHNPGRGAVLHLRVDGGSHPASRRVSLLIDDRVVHGFDVTSDEMIDREVPLAAGDFGAGRETTLTIQVDKTFVPAQSGGTDARELGVRVYHVFMEPRGQQP